MIYEAILIFLTGILGIWKSVPLGLLLEAPPLVIFLMTALGGITGVLILFFFGDLVRQWTRRKKEGKPGNNRKSNTAQRLFQKYGTPGLGFFGSLILGPNLTIVLGLLLVKSRMQLLYWTLAGTALWSLVLTLTGVLSIDLFEDLTHHVKLF